MINFKDKNNHHEHEYVQINYAPRRTKTYRTYT